MIYPDYALSPAWENAARRYPQLHTMVAQQARPDACSTDSGLMCGWCGKAIPPGAKVVLRIEYRGDAPASYCSKAHSRQS